MHSEPRRCMFGTSDATVRYKMRYMLSTILSLLGKRCSSGGRGGELSNDLAQPFLYLSYN